MKGKPSLLKNFCKFFTLILAVFLVVECGFLIFVDRSYLSENTNNITVEKIDEKTENIDPNLTITLTGDEEDIKSSYDGKFIAYTKDEALNVINMVNGKTYVIPMDEDFDLNYYQWIYDSNKLIIAEKQDKSEGNAVKLYKLETKTLDATTEPEEIRDTVNNRTAEIQLPTASYDITSIDLSTYTVTTFLKLSKNDEYSKLWKFNIPEQNYMYSKLSVTNIGKIQCLKNKAELLYEDKDKNTVNIAGTGTVYVNGEKNIQLAGFDRNDNVFFAKGSDSTTDTIYYGSLTIMDDDDEPEITTKPKLETIELNEPVKVDNITVTINGEIYANDESSNTFTNLKTNTKTSYQGKVLDVYSKGFFTIDSDNVIKANVFA